MGIIRQLLDGDKSEIDANLISIRDSLVIINNYFAGYEDDLSEMESKFVNKKIEPELEVIKNNCIEIDEKIENYHAAITKVYSKIEEADGVTK